MESTEASAAIALLNALFAAFDKDAWARCFLNLHKEASAFDPLLTSPSARQTDDFLELYLTFQDHPVAKLTLSACLASLCLAEVNEHAKSADTKVGCGPFCADAKNSGVFELVMTSIKTGLKVQSHALLSGLPMCKPSSEKYVDQSFAM